MHKVECNRYITTTLYYTDIYTNIFYNNVFIYFILSFFFFFFVIWFVSFKFNIGYAVGLIKGIALMILFLNLEKCRQKKERWMENKKGFSKEEEEKKINIKLNLIENLEYCWKKCNLQHPIRYWKWKTYIYVYISFLSFKTEENGTKMYTTYKTVKLITMTAWEIVYTFTQIK